jgi:hypothetical protein
MAVEEFERLEARWDATVAARARAKKGKEKRCRGDTLV